MNTDEQKLEHRLHDLTARLEHRIRTAPPLSQTAYDCYRLLLDLRDPSCPLTLEQRVARLDAELKRFAHRLQYHDPIHAAPWRVPPWEVEAFEAWKREGWDTYAERR